MSRDDMIGAGDLVMVAVSERNTMGAFFDPADVIGRRMKIGLGVNQPLMARHLHPDYLVEEGSEILISTSAGGISVDMVGYALENGQIGEWIGVENASSGKTIRGKITGEKKVSVIAKK
ncbi:MAG: flagellar basal body P-ring formation chaperone FlgA [Pseudomonadota bacterium]|nr:flagellar basal body P-ring formation chaperone FlgA [Pseudomonadota bacterium]